MAKREVAKPEDYRKPVSFETFNKMGSYNIRELTDRTVSACNGNVNVEKYRITVERIEEPVEVYSERLNKLWDECDNYHNWDIIRMKARELGVTLIEPSAGKNRKRN